MPKEYEHKAPSKQRVLSVLYKVLTLLLHMSITYWKNVPYPFEEINALRITRISCQFVSIMQNWLQSVNG